MSSSGLALELKDMLTNLQEKGVEQLEIGRLIKLVGDIANTPEDEPFEAKLANYEARLQLHIEQAKHKKEVQLELFRSVVTSAMNALKSSFLMNGGASVALLAFIGHLAQFKPEKITSFAACLLIFVAGVLLITLTSGFTYLCQWLYSRQDSVLARWAFSINILAMLSGLGSYLLFGIGMYKTYVAFTNFV